MQSRREFAEPYFCRRCTVVCVPESCSGVHGKKTWQPLALLIYSVLFLIGLPHGWAQPPVSIAVNGTISGSGSLTLWIDGYPKVFATATSLLRLRWPHTSAGCFH